MKKKANPVRKQILVIALLSVGLIVVLAFIYDMNAIQRKRTKSVAGASPRELTNILLMESLVTYRDPEGLFACRIPENWFKESKANTELPYNVVFRSPNGFSMSVIATPLDKPKSFMSLKRDIESIQSQKGLNMNIRTGTFGDVKSIRRDVVLHYSKIMVLDFVKNGVAHEIQIEVPHRYDDRVYEILEELFTGYEPGTNAVTGKLTEQDHG